MPSVERVCVIGAGGMLGRELVARLQTSPEAPDTVPLDLDEIDIADGASVVRVLSSLRPLLVFNAAAYTDVDACESQPDRAYAINAAGPGHLAEACQSLGARLVHVSTDYVFDGRRRTPYEPHDVVNPLNVYGRSKAEGERRIRERLADHLIVRTSWLFAPHGRNFVRTILRAARERSELRVVADQVGSPTCAKDLAAALISVGRSELTGTYHYCNAGACSWYGFAEDIVRLAGLPVQVTPITSDQLSRPAVRPAYSVLSTAKIAADAGIRPRSWEEALSECIGVLECSGARSGP